MLFGVDNRKDDDIIKAQQNDWMDFMEVTYEEFIKNILMIRGRHGCGEGYCETHHIMPRCIGGVDDEDNLIDLYAREHFEAHRLLALENPDNNSLRYAWWMMSHGTKRNYQDRYELTPEEYEEAKKSFSELHRQYRASEETRKKISENHADISGENNPFYGKCHSKETKNKISASRKGKYGGIDNPNYGKLWTEEQRQKQSETVKKRFENTDERVKLSNTMKKRLEDASLRQRISDSVKKKWNDAEIRKKYIENHADVSGANNPRAKPVLCIETKQIYAATSIASDATGVSKSGIRNCCNEVCKTAGNYQWKFIYDTTRRNGTFIPGAITIGLITEQEVNEILNNTK